MATQTEPEKKKSKYNLTPQEEQQEKLNRLFEKIDKPVFIPNKQEDKAFVPPPKDFVRNVAGSSAGAGSGDFHVYRAQRRREYARLKVMEDEEKRQEKEQREYEEKLKRLRQADEERTAKKRAKRQKRSKNKKDTKEKKDTDDTVKDTKEDSPEQQQQQQ